MTSTQSVEFRYFTGASNCQVLRSFYIRTLSILLILALTFAAKVGVAGDDRIQSVSPCERAISHLTSALLVLAMTDPLVAGLSIREKNEDRRQFDRWQNRFSFPGQDLQDQHGFRVWAINQELELRPSLDSWAPQELTLFRYGSLTRTEIFKKTVKDLRKHLSTKPSAPYSKTAALTLDAFTNQSQVMSWMSELRREVLTEMWNDGHRNVAALNEAVLREYYLDRVLAHRAAAHGFQINSDGMPHSLMTFSGYFFASALARGWFFVDWTGVLLKSGINSGAHFSRGHALQLAYAAEHVPHFVDLVKYIGRTMDHHGIWLYLFDNASNTETPLWGGYWVSTFSSYLGIRY